MCIEIAAKQAEEPGPDAFSCRFVITITFWKGKAMQGAKVPFEPIRQAVGQQCVFNNFGVGCRRRRIILGPGEIGLGLNMGNQAVG